MHFIVVSTLLSLVSAAPALTSRRVLAGGPAIVPIPANCTLQDERPTKTARAFKVTDSFAAAHAVFTEHLPDYYTKEDSQKTCLEQCYGFGNPGDCVSTLWANNVTYTAYGATNRGNTCVMYSAYITDADLVKVDNGEYIDARATNIRCPSPRNP